MFKFVRNGIFLCHEHEKVAQKNEKFKGNIIFFVRNSEKKNSSKESFSYHNGVHQTSFDIFCDDTHRCFLLTYSSILVTAYSKRVIVLKNVQIPHVALKCMVLKRYSSFVLLCAVRQESVRNAGK